MRDDRARYVDRLRDLQRRATRPDGLAALLRGLARRPDEFAVLADADGRPLHAFPDPPPPALAKAREDIGRVAAGRIRSAAVSLPGQEMRVLAIGEDPGAILIVGSGESFTQEEQRLVGDAAGLLWLRWRVDELDRRRRQVDLAERHNREAVLHWLMTGDLPTARRAAGVLGPELPDVVRVYVVECPVELRDDTVRDCQRASDGKAWIVRCPVYDRHINVLAPAEYAADDAWLDRMMRELAAGSDEVCVGTGQAVALCDTAIGYGQAFHALAAARNTPEGFSRYTAREDLTALLGPGGQAWALALLWPLLDHVPERRQDPDAAELTDTLQSWLAFYGRAVDQLKIHRNTLAARMRHLERLLGCDLSDVATQARLDLALRILDRSGSRGTPQGAPDPDGLDALLGGRGVRRWAEVQLAPLAGLDPVLFTGTLRAWLDGNARLDRTAQTLGVSVAGVRKRLVRIEDVLERSLLTGPSARYDLWLALRILDLRDASFDK